MAACCLEAGLHQAADGLAGFDRQELVASDRLATVTADEARAAVATYRALGGGWQPEAFERVASAAARND